MLCGGGSQSSSMGPSGKSSSTLCRKGFTDQVVGICIQISKIGWFPDANPILGRRLNRLREEWDHEHYVG